MTAVSVVILTFQRPRRLWQALQSVGLQTYPDVEVIVVNNGGIPVDSIIDRYWQEFKRPLQLVTLRTPAQNTAIARNVGIAVAKGEIIALLDDDDRYRPTHLAHIIQALEQQPDAVLAYDDALILIEDSANAEDEPHVMATCRLGLPYEKQLFEQNDYILTSAVAIRRTALDANGGFDHSLDHLEDWEIVLRLRDQGALLYVPGEIGVEYSMRIHATDHKGAVFDDSRRACLDWLTARYNLPPLMPKTFYDVAHELGCEVIPVTGTVNKQENNHDAF